MKAGACCCHQWPLTGQLPAVYAIRAGMPSGTAPMLKPFDACTTATLLTPAAVISVRLVTADCARQQHSVVTVVLH